MSLLINLQLLKGAVWKHEIILKVSILTSFRLQRGGGVISCLLCRLLVWLILLCGEIFVWAFQVLLVVIRKGLEFEHIRLVNKNQLGCHLLTLIILLLLVIVLLLVFLIVLLHHYHQLHLLQQLQFPIILKE